MTTTKLPAAHTELASVSLGGPHILGQQYADVDVLISVRRGSYRCQLVLTHGSCQGYDDEHGCINVVGRGVSVAGAASDALYYADKAGASDNKLLHEAISQAVDQAMEEDVSDSA